MPGIINTNSQPASLLPYYHLRGAWGRVGGSFPHVLCSEPSRGPHHLSPNSPRACKALPGNSGPCGQPQGLPGLTPPSAPALTTPGLCTRYFQSETLSSSAPVHLSNSYPFFKMQPKFPLCNFSQLPWPALLCASKHAVSTFYDSAIRSLCVFGSSPLFSKPW